VYVLLSTNLSAKKGKTEMPSLNYFNEKSMEGIFSVYKFKNL